MISRRSGCVPKALLGVNVSLKSFLKDQDPRSLLLNQLVKRVDDLRGLLLVLN